ncbi:hypothetical protein [Pseudoxanthomonas winnipegensis]|nr:hypothetical protein [Pseudoxanthomonas winnipegensis]RZZ88368.1 hypothetical protein EA663_05940 [Pseudoxanthomonas winnipegensis]
MTKIAAVAFPASLFYRRYGVGVTRAPSLHLTIHSSRSLFTGRLNSGVRPLNGVLWGNKVEESKNGGAGNNEPADERDSTSFRPGMDPIRATRDMVLKPKAILGAFLVYGGTAAYLFLGNISSIQELLYTHSRELVAIPLVLIGMYLFVSEFMKSRARYEPRFVDVDVTTKRQNVGVSMLGLAAKIEELQLALEASKSLPRTDATQGALPPPRTPSPDVTFVLYFESIRSLLEQKAEVADKKASILLDKGTAYSRFGIGFFVFAIITWQVVAHYTGFQIQYIYGIVSTSLLFVFIEFLSAWFLKQYRQFVDTSTYLIKVKSIFDKYMLVYLAGKEAIAEGHDSRKATRMLFGLLSEEIAWPDTYLTKNPDVNFAKEALEAMTLMIKSIKADAKSRVDSRENADEPA